MMMKAAGSQAIAKVTRVPSEDLRECWDRIIVDPGVKDYLLNHALLALRLRRQGVSKAAFPVHGLAILTGPPGGGKSTLAKGLANELATVLTSESSQVRVAEVNSHLLNSELLGRSQANIVRLFDEEIPALAEAGPLVVVVDEIESLAVERSTASLALNPVDTHRATEAMLWVLDRLASTQPNVFFVATTNFVADVDSALMSRADVVLEMPVTNAETAVRILLDSIRELAVTYPECSHLEGDPALLDLGRSLAGVDGRRLRKLVVHALASSRETAVNPGLLDLEALFRAAEELLGSPMPLTAFRNEECRVR